MDPQPSLPKQNFPWLKLLGYGFLLFIVTNILIFILSIVTGTPETENPMKKYFWVGIVLALLLTACSWFFSRRFHPASSREAFTHGVIWAVMNVGFMLLVTIPNGTTSIIFGQWSAYLIYVGIAVGPLLVKKKPAEPDINAVK
ncbi:MAG: hypothetical protein V1668_02320 [Patescibacteria group bacterium]